MESDILSPKGSVSNSKGHTAPVSDAAIFGNNRYLISGARDNSVKIWDIKEQKEINSLIGEKGRDAFSFVGVSADEKYFFRGGSKEVSMWEMASQKLVFNKRTITAFIRIFLRCPTPISFTTDRVWV